jgi:hypothetical protein
MCEILAQNGWLHGGEKSMKTRQILIVTLVLVVLLTCCSFPKQVVTTSQVTTTPINGSTSEPTSQSYPTALATQPETPDLIPSPTFLSNTPQGTPVNSAATPALSSQVLTQYNLDAIFNYYQHSLSISEIIKYMNNNNEELVDLMLVVEPNLWQGSFTLLSLTWENGENIDNYDFKNKQLNIPLLQPLQPGERLGIRINYQLDIPPLQAPSELVRPVPYGYTLRQTNIVDWYPYIPPYRNGAGWLVHPQWFFGEHQVFDVADFQVKISLTEPVQDLLIAASAPAYQDGETYSYHLESARTFALSAGTEYLIHTANAGDVTVYSYSFPYDKYAGQEVLQNTVDALLLYSKLIMPYPHASLSVVEADFLDGMEYEGLFFLSHGFYDLYDGTPKGYLTFIAAHETAHQWWYGLVGNDQALEPWLDEALCTYMEHIFYENVYPEYPPRSGESLVNWWWYYRVDFYNPSGWVDSSIYDFNQYRLYRDAIYLNGAKFLEDLRELIGDQAFFAFLQDYAHKKTHDIGTASDFFQILRGHTTQDLSSLLGEYFQFIK